MKYQVFLKIQAKEFLFEIKDAKGKKVEGTVRSLSCFQTSVLHNFEEVGKTLATVFVKGKLHAKVPVIMADAQ